MTEQQYLSAIMAGLREGGLRPVQVESTPGIGGCECPLSSPLSLNVDVYDGWDGPMASATIGDDDLGALPVEHEDYIEGVDPAFVACQILKLCGPYMAKGT